MSLADKQIKAVIFDLGDTLLNFGKVDTGSLFLKAGRLSYEYLKNADQPVGGFQRYLWGNLLGIRAQSFFSGLFGNDFDSLEILKTYGHRKKYTLTDEQWEDVNRCWYQPLKELTKVESDLIETLTALKDAGLKLGILSNTFVNACSLDTHLQELGILDFFPMRIYSYQYEFRKPNIKIFQTAAEKIDTPAANILFVGDRVNKDVNGALKAGMRAALIKTYTNAGKQRPEGTIEIEKIAELPEIIKKINSGT
ncbi:MAG: HAD family hydrolase [Planctomycetes bacterium]|nr:HAD family hydrolase [Planctomycetota bacterium]